MSETPRRRVSLKSGAPPPDPRRKPVRPGAPHRAALPGSPPPSPAGLPPSQVHARPPRTSPGGPPAALGRGQDARRRDVQGVDARGADARRPDPRVRDARGPDSQGRDAPGPDPRGLDARGDRPAHQRPARPTPSPTRPQPLQATPQAPQRTTPGAPAAPARNPVGRSPSGPLGLAGDGVRVSKLITERGLASRREADEWIAAGWVRVDGRLAVLGLRAPPDAVIDIDPRARNQQARRVTVLLHKPVGYVSGQAEDGHEPAIVLVTPANRWPGDDSRITFHPGHLRSLAPAGRLDIDSTGLLVLTQDGRIAKRLIGDDTRVEKEYLVRVRPLQPGPLPDDALDRLRLGLELDGQPLKLARVSWQNEDQLRIVLREGKKRQIRRMCDLVGLDVLGLKRVRIGSVVLSQLPPGQWRYLRDDERF